MALDLRAVTPWGTLIKRGIRQSFFFIHVTTARVACRQAGCDHNNLIFNSYVKKSPSDGLTLPLERISDSYNLGRKMFNGS